MVFQKRTIKLIGTFMSVIILLVGISLLGYDYSNWFIFLISIMVGLALIFEVGLKKVTNISNLKNIGTQQYITLIVAGVIFLSAIFQLVGITIPFITDLSGYAVMLGGILFVIETWTNN